MTVYVMTWHDRHVDDKITVHETLHGALVSLLAERETYELHEGEKWNEERLGTAEAYIGSQDGDTWGGIDAVELQP